MQELIIRIFFHGLIALAPGDASGAMTAYSMKHAEHRAQLTFEQVGRTNCPAPCKQEEHDLPDLSWCVCDLAGLNVSFKQATVGAGEVITVRSGKPTGTVAAGNPGWLAHLHNINNTVVRVDKSKIMGFTVSGFDFNWTSVRSCHLDQIGSESSPGDFELHAFDFKEAGVVKRTQALAEYVAFEVHIPFGLVTLVLTDRATKKEVAAINLDCDQHSCPDLLVANTVPLEPPQPDDGGKHFLAYYDLALGNLYRFYPERNMAVYLPIEDRQLHNCLNDPIRRRRSVAEVNIKDRSVTCSASKTNRTSFEHLDCAVITITAAESRIICPSAMFDP